MSSMVHYGYAGDRLNGMSTMETFGMRRTSLSEDGKYRRKLPLLEHAVSWGVTRGPWLGQGAAITVFIVCIQTDGEEL